ncbi:MAG: hypothetical protein V4719_27035, partial [Planctomycetota bacterium]
LGGDNLSALKQSLAAKPVSRKAVPPISLQVKAAALILILKDQEADLLERAKKIAGQPGDRLNVDIAPISGGAKLRVEFGLDLLKLAAKPAEEN